MIRFTSHALGTWLALAAMAWLLSPMAHAAPQKPNILVIWGDDIGTWNISHNNRGMMGYRTPNIDRIADAAGGAEAEPPPSFDVGVFDKSFATEFVVPRRIGVPTARKTRSACPTAGPMSVVNVSRPAPTLRATRSSRRGS